MTKKQAIKIITQCAQQYQQHLEGNQVTFVYRDQNNHSNYTSVRFRSYNFLHFTGVLTKSGMNANGFYRAALNNRLSEKGIFFKNNHTTELKLKVLDQIMNIDTTACLGLIRGKNFYIPNSILSEDIRSIIPKPPGKIYAIFKKPIKSTLYTELTYKSPHTHLTKKMIPPELLNQIDFSLLKNDNDTSTPTD